MWRLAAWALSAVLLGGNTALAFDCTGVRLPSSVVICSDPELIRLADERQQAFNEARWGKGGTELLDSEHDKELWENQRAWVHEYAAACGIPPDKPPPRPPIPVAVIACFKHAAQARIEFLRSYRERATAVAARRSTARLGPSFDCTSATRPLGRMICGDEELSLTDLLFNQAYWALYQQLDESARRKLATEDVRFLDLVHQVCSIPREGTVVQQTPAVRQCVNEAYGTQRSVWLRRLNGPAREEAVRPIQLHIALERKLRELAFLKEPPVPDGVYNQPVRRAIMAWQTARGRAVTGILGDADATALQTERQTECARSKQPYAVQFHRCCRP